jgi:hypothetical protein
MLPVHTASGYSADVEASSVDRLCDFGAKNFNARGEFTQNTHGCEANTSLLFSHLHTFFHKMVLMWCVLAKSVSSRGAVVGSG